jgi:hypothetical protein
MEKYLFVSSVNCYDISLLFDSTNGEKVIILAHI